MQYKLINWIKTDYWEGALVQSENGNQYLTHGIKSWGPAPHRKYEVVERINNVSEFMRRWRENYPYDTLII